MAAKPKVLIVDDEPTIRKMYALKFSNVDFDVITANDGTDAYNIMIKEKPDLILLDILMPKMNGYEFLRKKKEANITTPVIVLSNLDQESEAEKSCHLGAIGYMVKAHVTPGQVLSKAKSCLSINPC